MGWILLYFVIGFVITVAAVAAAIRDGEISVPMVFVLWVFWPFVLLGALIEELKS